MEPQPPKARLAGCHCPAPAAEHLLLGTGTAALPTVTSALLQGPHEVGQRKGNETCQADTKRKPTEEHTDKKTKMRELSTATT